MRLSIAQFGLVMPPRENPRYAPAFNCLSRLTQDMFLKAIASCLFEDIDDSPIKSGDKNCFEYCITVYLFCDAVISIVIFFQFSCLLVSIALFDTNCMDFNLAKRGRILCTKTL